MPDTSAVTLVPLQFLNQPGPEVAALVIVLFSITSGLLVQRFGFLRCFPHLFCAFAVLMVFGVFAARFFAIDLLVIPLVISGIGSPILVQLHSLWKLDRQLSRTILRSPPETELVKPHEATTRLKSGLKLLNVVLPLSEAVVFQCSTTEDFQTVARLKGGTGPLDDPTRNALWRDGVNLCERAVRSKDLVLQVGSNGNASTVAVPLKHEQNIVGVLLLRLNAEFCDEDRPLLEGVGAQFARNLARDTFSRNLFNNSLLSYFSTAGNEKKLDALHVWKARATEQQCEGDALSRVSDGIAIAYLDGTLALVNPTFLSFAELTQEASRSIDVFSLLDRFRTDVFDEPAIAVRRVLQSGVDYEGELNFELRNQILGLRISLLREAVDSGEPCGLAIFVRDLTKEKEYEKLKSDMISLMSHELRTPLTSINGFAELLSSDQTIPDQAKEFVTIIANESQRMSRMINTFLSVTQLQRKDKQEVLKIPLRLDEVVRDTIATMQPIAKKKRIRLVEKPAHRVPPVAADKSLITQAVKNLVNNAIKYSPERTTVTVSTALEAESVRVSVEDRGFGIPAESRDRVWEKFYRVVREGQEKDEESTGLGLSFVRQVIEQHGGSVAVDSQEGRGSKFSFTLPRL